MMPRNLFRSRPGCRSVVAFLAAFWLVGCGSKDPDPKRIQALNSLPVLYESTILTAVINNPAPDAFFPMDDASDPNLASSIQGDYHTANYIPDSVLAITLKRAGTDSLKRQATIKIGDKVSVLAQADNGGGKSVYLVRTAQNTYCWLYPFHLEDKDGRRIAEMP